MLYVHLWFWYIELCKYDTPITYRKRSWEANYKQNKNHVIKLLYRLYTGGIYFKFLLRLRQSSLILLEICIFGRNTFAKDGLPMEWCYESCRAMFNFIFFSKTRILDLDRLVLNLILITSWETSNKA